MAKIQKIEIGLFIRKAAPGQFSLEYLFKEIYNQLPTEIDASWLEAPYSSRGIWNRVRLIFWARRNRKRVNHITGDIHFINLLLPKASNILTIHDCEFILRSSGVKRWLLTWIWIRLPVWRSQVVTTISQDAKNDIVHLSGCKPEKVVVIPNFVSEVFEKGCDKPTGGPFKVLHVGTKHNKNLKRLIKASIDQNWELHIVGSLNEVQNNLLENCQLEYHNYVGISREDLIYLYQNCDVLVFTSLKEGFGLPILEAQQCGMPVITSSISSMPEVAGEGAILVNPYQVSEIRAAIQSVQQDYELRMELKGKGIKNAKKFSLKNTVKQFSHLYKLIQTG